MIVRPSEIEPGPPASRAQRLPPARVTWLLLASIALAFSAQLAVMGENPYVLVRLGANVSPLVHAGQWDRLVTANWLHAGWVHVGVNSVGLFFMGLAMERLVGSGRFFVIYALSCLAGAAASMAMSRGGVPSVGASTGLAGLFAALGYVLFRFRSTLPPFLRRASRQWLLWLGINVLLWVAVGFIGVNIDHAGHAGGFAMGGVATAVLTFRWPPFVRKRAAERRVRGLAWALLAVIVTGLGVSAARFATGTEDARFARAILHSEDATPVELNTYAWFTAIDPDADPELLGLAERMARRAIELLPDDEAPEVERMIADTLATCQYRLGELDLAVSTQRAVFDGESNAIYGSQLARFLAARLDRDGPIVAPEGGPSLELALTGAPYYDVRIDGEAPGGLVYYAVVDDGEGEILGLVWGRLVADGEVPRRLQRSQDWPAGARIRVGLTDSTERVEGDPARPRSVSMDPEIAAYP